MGRYWYAVVERRWWGWVITADIHCDMPLRQVQRRVPLWRPDLVDKLLAHYGYPEVSVKVVSRRVFVRWRADW